MNRFKSSKYLVLLFLLISFIQFSTSTHENDLKMTFDEFLKKFKKPEMTVQEYLKREFIFYQNIGKLRKLIQQQKCQFCGVTKFYDQTNQEFHERMGLLIQQKRFQQHIDRVSVNMNNNENGKIDGSITSSNLIGTNSFNPNDYMKLSALPTSKNWAGQKKITSIKNQGKCGTCWSFATAAAIQSSMIIKGKFFNYLFYQPDLSQQFLLNCATFGSCNGGYLEQTIDLAFSRGIPYQYDSPYLGYKGDKTKCSDTSKNIFFSQGSKARQSFYNIQDQKIIQLLMEGPLMISISSNNWQNYAGGVFKCSSTAKVDHAVLLVGFDSGKWIVKNQWGDNWGQDGYIYITRDKTGNCKIGSSIHQLYQNRIFSLSILIIFVMVCLFY